MEFSKKGPESYFWLWLFGKEQTVLPLTVNPNGPLTPQIGKKKNPWETRWGRQFIN